jgi:hypothetical protein
MLSKSMTRPLRRFGDRRAGKRMSASIDYSGRNGPPESIFVTIGLPDILDSFRASVK